MEKSKVYFTDMRCRFDESMLEKLEKLMDKAGISKIDFENKYVAIKMHFGEPGNLSFLRPNFAKTVADKVKQLGGKPFLTDCNTLYVGRRKDALEHLGAAQENGFNMATTGCQVLIGDGLKGTDDIEVPVEGGLHCKTALIGRAVMDADVFISLTHFKGHEQAGFGGTIKNIGMGCGSRAGKMQMHSEGKPIVSQKMCKACHMCEKACAQNAFMFGQDGKASINHNNCVGCGHCIGACNFNAISNPTDTTVDVLNEKMSEYTKAVVDKRSSFHISVVTQVSPKCDCYAGNDAAIVPDIGIFASYDLVALEKACIDAVNAAPIIAGSVLDEMNINEEKSHDHFKCIHSSTNWISQLEHAEKLGLGSMAYEKISV